MRPEFMFNEYIRIPTSLSLSNIFDKGLSPFFYVTYIYLASRICLAKKVTFTVVQIVGECRKNPTKRNQCCPDVVSSIEYLADNGYIVLDTGIGKYDEPVEVSINQDAFYIRRNYSKIKYSDYRKITGLVNRGYSKPEYALLLYLYIAPQIFTRADRSARAFFEKRETTCSKLGISGYYYDLYTNLLDELMLLIKWRPNIKYYNSNSICSLPNIYTKPTRSASSVYWEALSILTGIDDMEILTAMTKPDEKRIPATG